MLVLLLTKDFVQGERATKLRTTLTVRLLGARYPVMPRAKILRVQTLPCVSASSQVYSP